MLLIARLNILTSLISEDYNKGGRQMITITSSLSQFQASILFKFLSCFNFFLPLLEEVNMSFLSFLTFLKNSRKFENINTSQTDICKLSKVVGNKIWEGKYSNSTDKHKAH